MRIYIRISIDGFVLSYLLNWGWYIMSFPNSLSMNLTNNTMILWILVIKIRCLIIRIDINSRFWLYFSDFRVCMRISTRCIINMLCRLCVMAIMMILLNKSSILSNRKYSDILLLISWGLRLISLILTSINNSSFWFFIRSIINYYMAKSMLLRILYILIIICINNLIVRIIFIFI